MLWLIKKISTMASWKILYLDELSNWLDKLDKQQLKSVAKELRLLEISGNQLRLPPSKALGLGLFELRERAFGLRIYYAFQTTGEIIILYAGNKKGQERDILQARKLLSIFRGKK